MGGLHNTCYKKVIIIEYCTPCDGGGVREHNIKTDRNVPLHKKSKTDNSDLRKKIFEPSTFHVFAKNLIKFMKF